MKKIVSILVMASLITPGWSQTKEQFLKNYGQTATGAQDQANRLEAEKIVGKAQKGTYTEQSVIQEITGVQGVERAGEPTQKGVVGAFANAVGSTSFKCMPQATFSVHGIQGFISQCSPDFSSMTVATCDLRAGDLCNADWKTRGSVIKQGASLAIQGGYLQYTCTSAGACTATVSLKSGVAASAAGMEAAVANKAGTLGANSISAGMTQAYKGDEYQQGLKKQGEYLNNCIQNDVQGNLSAGRDATSCTAPEGEKVLRPEVPTEKASVGLNNKVDNNKCTVTKSCKVWGTKDNLFDRLCVKQATTSKYQYDKTIPTFQCSLSKQPEDFKCTRITTTIGGDSSSVGCEDYINGTGGFYGTVKKSESCAVVNTMVMVNGVNTLKAVNTCETVYSGYGENSPTTNSCPDADKGLLVLEDKDQCVKNSAGAGSGCVSWTNYYAEPDKAEIVKDSTNIIGGMLKGTVSNACATGGAGYYSQCKEGGWYKRTLSNAECTFNQKEIVNGSVVETTGDLSVYDKPGCGFCINPTYADICYSQGDATNPVDDCSHIPNTCTLKGVNCTSASGNICLAQAESYSCNNQEKVCLEWETTRGDDCIGTDLSHGAVNAVKNMKGDNNMNAALAAGGVASSIAQSLEKSGGAIPLIFGGEDQRCRKPDGPFSSLSNNCCNSSLERPGGGKPLHKCDMGEVKLAAARRSNRAVYIGDYCSKSIKVFKKRICTEKTETYCTFQGILPKLIQTQGRQQLMAFANSSAGATIEKTNKQFAYYGGEGQWLPGDTVNGNTVYTWQWPQYCANPETAMLETNVVACPAVPEVWFASCDSGKCGPMPVDPNQGSDGWNLQVVNPLKNETSALSKYVMATGACDTGSGNCTYELAAWPAGQGGRALVTTQVTWPVYSDKPDSTSAKSSNVSDGYVNQGVYNVGDIMFKPYSYVGNTASGMPAAFALEYSVNGGQSWSVLNVPNKVNGTNSYIPGTDIRYTGACDLAANLCDFKFTGTVYVTAKPWGSPENPDCKGFSIGQVSALDFSKMDLSEWISTVVKNNNALNGQDAGALTQAMVDDFYNTYKAGGVVKASNPSAVKVAIISPREEYGPFDATLSVTGNYPEWYSESEKNVDPVSRVEADFDDCTGTILLERDVQANGLWGFRTRHRFASPAAKDGGICGKGDMNFVHKVRVTIYAKSGIYYTTTQVKNIYKNFEGAVGNGEGAGGNVNTQSTAVIQKAPTLVPGK